MSVRSKRVESTTFSTHPQSPDALYFLRFAQIDFRYDESTSRETIRVDSIESSRIDNTFNPPSKPDAQIDFQYNESTSRVTSRVDFIKEGSQIDFRLVESSIPETNRL